MICPKCGYNNDEESCLCSGCNYRFELGHAFNDPGKMTFIPQSKSTKTLRIIFFLIFLGVFILLLFTR